MNRYKLPFLQPYKGKTTRHVCPECGKNQSFTLYLDGYTKEPIHRTVGKCNRESKCRYHYTPKQYFIDNPHCIVKREPSYEMPNRKTHTQPVIVVGTLPFIYVQKSYNDQSNFMNFLSEILTMEQRQFVSDRYLLGATKNKEVIFWQIDVNGMVRTGKIMQYNPETGKRIKHASGAIDWAHNKLKKFGILSEDFKLKQCFFGEHLLSLYPETTVCIVESEKSAIISGAFFQEVIWLATGGIGNLSIDKCNVLKGRNIILFPDLNAYDKWLKKSIEIQNQYNCKIIVSTILV